ncbi:MAG TPA: nitrile hydratase subunit alpha, partial [Candidatus Elarobacter sp.]
LGPSPSWYKSEAYRSRAVRDPRGVLAEFGTELGDDVAITVWDSTAEVRYLVLPLRPPGTDEATEAQLAALVTRNGMIGTAIV